MRGFLPNLLFLLKTCYLALIFPVLLTAGSRGWVSASGSSSSCSSSGGATCIATGASRSVSTGGATCIATGASLFVSIGGPGCDLGCDQHSAKGRATTIQK